MRIRYTIDLLNGTVPVLGFEADEFTPRLYRACLSHCPLFNLRTVRWGRAMRELDIKEQGGGACVFIVPSVEHTADGVLELLRRYASYRAIVVVGRQHSTAFTFEAARLGARAVVPNAEPGECDLCQSVADAFVWSLHARLRVPGGVPVGREISQALQENPVTSVNELATAVGRTTAHIRTTVRTFVGIRAVSLLNSVHMYRDAFALLAAQRNSALRGESLRTCLRRRIRSWHREHCRAHAVDSPACHSADALTLSA